ncbi:MAG: hypothetical protein KDC12_02210 [Flavobacteriales bacterium]|nr:hypothetical protein [Flavobacteriales bacterium]
MEKGYFYKAIAICGFLAGSFVVLSQDSSRVARNHLGGQLGGQMMIGLRYERTTLSSSWFQGNVISCVGLNANGDLAAGGPAGTYSIQTGFHLLAGRNWLFIEAGPFVNWNKSGPHTFANLNAWLGLQLKTKGGFSLCAGYTPILYKTFTESSNYWDSVFGIKLLGEF